jgi:hypothetical protein
MTEHEELAEQLRREFLRQAPQFDLHSSLPTAVSTLVRRRQRRRVMVAVGAVAVVVAAVAIPLSSLRSEPLGHGIIPATTPTSPVPTTTPPAATIAPLSCGTVDLRNSPPGTSVTTTTLGSVTATLTGTTASGIGGQPGLSVAELSVSLADGGHFSEPVSPPAQAPMVFPVSIAPVPSDPTTTPLVPAAAGLCLARFAGEALPTVLLGLFTGGAHCCFVTRAIGLSSSGFAPPVDDALGNPHASLSPDGAHALLVTADNSFAYAFSSYAASGMPVKVLTFSAGNFVDVTTQHPDLVTRDAARWWTAFNGPPGNGLGVLAPWVADECRLGQSASAWTTVDQLQAEGRLSGPAAWPQGAAYVQALKAFLAHHGYCQSPGAGPG